MTNKQKTIPMFIDLIPNVLKHAVGGPKEKKRIAKSLCERFELKIDDALTRYSSLPPLMVHTGDYCDLLMEARDLYIYDYFYSCVAMCGITAERIVKDIFMRSLLVILDGKAVPPNKVAIEDLESFGAKDICEFLIDAGILKKKLRASFKALEELRNKYAHAGGKTPEKDARNAIGHLHDIGEGTA